MTLPRPADRAARPAPEYGGGVSHGVPIFTYIASVGAGGATLYVSPQIQTLLGYAQDEWMQDPRFWEKRLHPEDRERVLAEYAQILTAGGAFNCEYRMLARDGREVWIREESIITLDESGRPEYAQGVMIDVDRYKRLEDELRQNEQRYRELFAAAERQAQELTLLDKVQRALARQLDPAAVFRTVVEAVAHVYGYTQVAVYLLKGEVLELQHALGYEHIIEKIPVSQGVSGRVAQTGTPVLLEDAQTDPAFLKAIEGVTSEVCVPLFDGQRVIGVLNVESVNNVKLTESDLRTMISLSEQVSIAVERARLYAEARRRSQLLAALHGTTLALMNHLDLPSLLETIVSQAARLIGTPHGFIYLPVADGDGLEIKVGIGVYKDHIGARLKPEQGLSGRVWQTGQPMRVDDDDSWPGHGPRSSFGRLHAALAAPLKSESRVVGVIGMAYEEAGRVFSEDDIELLSRFAQLASLALDNVRLYAAAKQELIERRRAERALAAANADLEKALLNANELALAAQAASRAKSAFIAGVSHEVRTPLSAVIGFAELALATDLKAEQREHVEQVRLAAETLLEMLSDILDFSKIENSQLELERVEFDLHELIKRAVAMLAPRAAAKKLKMDYAIEAGAPRAVIGDPTRLRQVLLNLLDNAVKFTEHGSVTLRAAAESLAAKACVVRFSIADTGIGIPPDRHALIFEPFTQADGATTRKYGGTGLGLTISRRLAEMFGGRIWLDSAPGRGSTFYCTVKLGLAAAPAERAARAPLTARARARRLSERRLRILLAEDNAINQKVIAAMLEKRGWEVTAVPDGEAAVTESAKGDYDLILMDVQMPKLDGLSATAAIRERERHTGRRIPIVAITAYAMPGDKERCLRAGMDDYITKPMRTSDLYSVVERAASRAGSG